jgi:hypothetical protein
MRLITAEMLNILKTLRCMRGGKMSQAPMPIDLSMLLQSQQQVFEMLNSILQQYGLTLELDRVDVEPEDCDDDCIDFVWRIKCKEKTMCFYLKEAIAKQYSK